MTKFNVGFFLLCHRPTSSAARRPNLSDNSAKFKTDKVDASLSKTRYVVPIILQWYCFSDFWTDGFNGVVLRLFVSSTSLEERHFFFTAVICGTRIIHLNQRSTFKKVFLQQYNSSQLNSLFCISNHCVKSTQKTRKHSWEHQREERVEFKEEKTRANCGQRKTRGLSWGRRVVFDWFSYTVSTVWGVTDHIKWHWRVQSIIH